MRMVEHMPSDLIPTAEAAQILRTTPSTVNRWAADGTLTPAAQAPGPTGARLYERADVEALAEQRRLSDLAKWDDTPAPSGPASRGAA